MEKILITGGRGFIGWSLTRALCREGYKVRILTRPKNIVEKSEDFEEIRGDIRDFKFVESAVKGVDTIFHLVSKVHDIEGVNNQGEHIEVTGQGTKNILESARAAKVGQVIFMSSLAVYGKTDQTLQNETFPLNPQTDYGRAKLQAEKMVLEYSEENGFSSCCLRPATVYGPGVKGNLLRMIQMIDRGRFPPLPPLENKRCMVHVQDLVRASIMAAKNPISRGKCYNITDEQVYSTNEIYEEILSGLHRRVPRYRVPLGVFKAGAKLGDAIGTIFGRRFPFDSRTMNVLMGSAWFSSELITKEIGFHPKRTLKDSIFEVVGEAPNNK